MSQTEGRPHSEAKEGHSLVYVCELRIHTPKGMAHEPMSAFCLPLKQFVTSYTCRYKVHMRQLTHPMIISEWTESPRGDSLLPGSTRSHE